MEYGWSFRHFSDQDSWRSLSGTASLPIGHPQWLHGKPLFAIVTFLPLRYPKEYKSIPHTYMPNVPTCSGPLNYCVTSWTPYSFPTDVVIIQITTKTDSWIMTWLPRSHSKRRKPSQQTALTRVNGSTAVLCLTQQSHSKWLQTRGNVLYVSLSLWQSCCYWCIACHWACS